MKLCSKRNGAWVAIAAAVGVPTLQSHHHAHSEPPPSLQTPAPSGAQPVDALKVGLLTLTRCELKQPDSAATTAAYCAPFEVPENRADPHSRKIQLKLAIVKSDAQIAAKDLVVYLAGGPGEAATQSYAQIAPALAPLRRHHDIVLLDQRGTGGSHPLECPQAAKAMQASADQPFDAQRVRAQTAQCLDEVEKTSDPRHYTTADAVVDLEAVRRALGGPQFDLIGISYGTRMAQQYARAYPHAVRSIVLDGVVPNQLVLGEDFAGNLERALKLQSAACVATPACEHAFGNPYAALHTLYDTLRAQPARAQFPNPKSFQPIDKEVSADTLASVARLFSYNAETAALLPLTVAQAAKGNYTPLMGQAQLLAGSLDTAMNTGMQLSVICSEDADLLQPNPQDAGTILGGEVTDAVKAECTVWPRGAARADFHAPFTSSIPTLLLSGERDPVTPPRYADEVLKGLSNARALTARGMGHSVLARGCVPKLVDQFVADLQPKKLDAACIKQIGPVPAFVDFNGATP
ncbi:MAG TPA: alpha/beta hydrolase [Rhodanobacteraceae bacterium]|nr:alpha/beta hydrolase [Rhodanobacteraceae bacterium]